MPVIPRMLRPVLFPNLGVEGGERWTQLQRIPAIRASTRLWALLFPAGTEIVGSAEAPWPEELCARTVTSAFPWLHASERLVAWLNTEDAQGEAERVGRKLWGPPPAVVSVVHDKAFALRSAVENGLVPEPLRGLSTIVDPRLLEDPSSGIAHISETVAQWPTWARGSFTVRPRTGTSGRGRVGGYDEIDTPSLRGAFPRLAERGGAIVEPWLDRTLDLSAQMFIGETGSIEWLGSLEQIVSPAGVYRGHRGHIDAEGRVSAGSRYDGALKDAAHRIARAAANAGFHGPCGVDAFAFRAEGREWLRPVVELNARFTAGTVTLGLIRRAMSDPARRRRRATRFEFQLNADALDLGTPETLRVVEAGEPTPSPPTGPTLRVGDPLSAVLDH